MTTPSSTVPEAGAVVAAAADASGRSCSRAKPTTVGDVVGARAARDQRRPLVDHRVVDRARLVVVGVVGADQPPSNPESSCACGLRGVGDCAHVVLLWSSLAS